MNDLSDTCVLVLGLGESGLAMARWCARLGASVRVWDSREAPPHRAALAEHVPGAQWVRGALTDAAFEGVHLVLKSPGLSPRDMRIAGPLGRAAESGMRVRGELELFAHALADLKTERGYAPHVLAVTGTNGKTTTTALTALLIARAGRRVAVAGNIGPTMLQTLADALDREPVAGVGPSCDPVPGAGDDVPVSRSGEEADAPDETFDAGAVSPSGDTGPEADGRVDAEGEVLPGAAGQVSEVVTPPAPAPVFEHLPEVWVLELSSFQLDGAQDFEPSAATVLNITQDHLDWHGSMEAYVAAKARVFGRTAVMVINRDDPVVERMVPEPVQERSARGRPARTVGRSVVRFGLDAPRRPGDFGLVEENGMAWLVRALEADETLSRSRTRRAGATAEPAEELHIQRLMPADALRVRGRHNAANALAALALASAIGCPLAPMLHGLREYTGEPHRVQLIASLDGVDAFDDSKGTNVGATVAALMGLGADRSPARLVVILGGDGKGQDFAPLAEPVRRHARAVALIGRDAARIEAALGHTGVALQHHDSLEAATRWCFAQARSGDAVLLSPACASLDMFRNYAHRAEVFAAEVRSVVADRGGVVA
ncbi:MAG: UDP-N-acetylmuramoyl-L-alanine--D-glutamate ligase [Burkholderiaceae bacterium]